MTRWNQALNHPGFCQGLHHLGNDGVMSRRTNNYPQELRGRPVRVAGHRVVVATSTNCELGIEDPVVSPPERLALIRERETAASLAALYVREHRWLGHRDGTLDQVPVAHGISQQARVDAVDCGTPPSPPNFTTNGPR